MTHCSRGNAELHAQHTVIVQPQWQQAQPGFQRATCTLLDSAHVWATVLLQFTSHRSKNGCQYTARLFCVPVGIDEAAAGASLRHAEQMLYGSQLQAGHAPVCNKDKCRTTRASPQDPPQTGIGRTWD